MLKTFFLLHSLESRDLTLVIALSLYHDVNASDFKQFIGYLNLVFLFACYQSIHSIVLHIMKASVDNVLIMPLA